MSNASDKGPWFWNYEGCWILKRQLFDADGNPAGFELLDGDHNAIAHERQVLLATCAALVKLAEDVQAYMGDLGPRTLAEVRKARDVVARAGGQS